MMSVFYFLLVITLLVFFHELGHFLTARLFKVKVLKFSIGFGKKLLSFKGRSGTEFVLAMIPLGGYIKMHGEEAVPDEPLDPMAFCNKEAWKRFLIVFAGPFFNFVLAFIVLWAMFQVGVYRFSPIVGEPTPNSIAYLGGIKQGDKIIQVGQTQVFSWQDFELEASQYIGLRAPLFLTVVNDGVKRTLNLSIENWILDTNEGVLKSLGLTFFLPPLPPIVGEVIEHSKADYAGLKSGDQILTLNGVSIKDWYQLVTEVKKLGQGEINLSINRAGNVKKVVITEITNSKQQQKGVLGVKSLPPKMPEGWANFVRYNPQKSLTLAAFELKRLCFLTLGMLKKLVLGSVSLDNLSGPISIAVGANQAAEGGTGNFLFFLAIVSVGLGILNLLPIPLLDGGHLLFIALEMILGKELPFEIKQKGAFIGLMVLFGLMFVAIKNDIKRLHYVAKVELDGKEFHDNKK